MSLSRTTTAVVVAISEDVPVGVDIDQPARFGFDGFGEVALAEGESANNNHDRGVVWVRKEAALKATGHGLAVGPTLLRVSPPSQAAALLEWAADEPAPTTLTMQDLDLGVDLVGCVAWLGDGDVKVSVGKAALADPAR